jgi:hypothetical protein
MDRCGYFLQSRPHSLSIQPGVLIVLAVELVECEISTSGESVLPSSIRALSGNNQKYGAAGNDQREQDDLDS